MNLNSCVNYAHFRKSGHILENQQIVLIVVFTTDISNATGKDLIF